MLTPHHLLFHYYYFFNSVPSGPKILATAMGSWSTGAVSSVLGAVTWRNALGSRENLNCECVWAEPSESAEQISPQFAPQPALVWCGRSSGKTLSLTISRDEPTSSLLTSFQLIDRCLSPLSIVPQQQAGCLPQVSFICSQTCLCQSCLKL